MTSPRLAAARVLVAVERGRTTLAGEVERARGEIEATRDRAFLLELTAGTLRWQNELDAVVAAHSQRPLADLDVYVRAILRLAIYQLRHLDRVPDHAVVHESVSLVRAVGRPRAAGFVNAVLRSALRARDRTLLPVRPDRNSATAEQRAYLTTSLSHPAWLVERWLDRHGFDDAEHWCQFNNRVPDVTVRLGAETTTEHVVGELVAAGVEASPGRLVRAAIRLSAGAIGKLPDRLRDRLHVQDEGSQLVALAVGAEPGNRVLDACAAPGGKTTVIAGRMAGQGVIVAADRRPARVQLLRSTLARAGVEAHVILMDVLQPLPFGPVFDRVLLDAPCSGLGTLARDPDLKWSRSPADFDRFAAAQRTMLRRAAEAVRPGGSIVYATCSSEPEENEHVVDAFLGEDPRFALEGFEALPGVAGTDWRDARGCLRTLPFRDGIDAYFAAKLVRRQRA